MSVTRIIRPGASARAIISEIAAQHGYNADALIGWSQERAVCRARSRAMKILREEKRWSLERIGKEFGGRSRKTVWAIISAHREREKSVSGYMRHPDLVHEVEAQMRRILGLNLTHQLACELSVPTWQAIFLAMLVEAYPRVMTAEQMLEAYEAATERLYQSDSGRVQEAQIRQFGLRIRRAFAEMGLPDPVISVRPRGMVLSYEAACWMHCKFGRPLAVPTQARMIA